MLRQTFVQRGDAAHLLQDFLRDVITDTLRVAELQIQYCLTEVGIGLTVSQQITRAAQQLRLFLFLLQPVCHLVVGATVGQDPDRGAGRRMAWCGVSVNRDQHVSIGFTRHVGTSHDRDKIVAIARQDAFEHRIVIEQHPQFACNRNRDVFLFQSALTDSAGILTAMSGINCHNHSVILADGSAGTYGTRGAGHGRHRIRIERVSRCGTLRRYARRCCDGRRHTARDSGRLAGNREDHAVAVAIALGDCPGFTRLRQFKHQPHALFVFWGAGTNSLYDVFATEIQRQSLNYAALAHIQHHTIRVVQREEGIDRLSGKIQRNGSLTIAIGHFDIRQRGGKQGRTDQQHQ